MFLLKCYSNSQVWQKYNITMFLEISKILCHVDFTICLSRAAKIIPYNKDKSFQGYEI